MAKQLTKAQKLNKIKEICDNAFERGLHTFDMAYIFKDIASVVYDIPKEAWEKYGI